MTTIIAARNEKNDTVDLGWDSLVSPNQGYAEKIKDINGQFFLGVAGYLRHLDVLHYTEVPPEHPAEFARDDFDARGYLVTQVVPAWVRALKQSHGDDPDTVDDWPKGSVMVVIKNRIFTMDSVFSVTEHLDFAGIGSGSDYALGALAAGKSVGKALEIAAQLDSGTGGDLRVMRGLK